MMMLSYSDALAAGVLCFAAGAAFMASIGTICDLIAAKRMPAIAVREPSCQPPAWMNTPIGKEVTKALEAKP